MNGLLKLPYVNTGNPWHTRSTRRTIFFEKYAAYSKYKCEIFFFLIPSALLTFWQGALAFKGGSMNRVAGPQWFCFDSTPDHFWLT